MKLMSPLPEESFVPLILTRREQLLTHALAEEAEGTSFRGYQQQIIDFYMNTETLRSQRSTTKKKQPLYVPQPNKKLQQLRTAVASKFRQELASRK